MTMILVIEDQPGLREDIVEMLNLEGFDVLAAPNGQIGVQIARHKLPDVIICDVMMPELDGYGVLIELRSEPITATIPFIFLTARADRSDLRKGMELGADDYLTKPFSLSELVAAVNVALDKQETMKKLYGHQAEELRENLLLTLPHELRTPLTGILGYGDLLMEDASIWTPDQIQNMAQMIVRSGNRLYRLIENYLLYAQIEIMKTDPDRVHKMRRGRTDKVSEIVTQIAEKKATEAGRVDDLKVTTESGTLAISEDSLRKIVEELVDNAFKFSKPGSVVEVNAAADPGAFIFTIRDQGRGLTAEQIKQIGAYMQFERKLYEQQGMGLGLTLVKNLTELYGGKLTIYSEPHRGTEVCVELLM